MNANKNEMASAAKAAPKIFQVVNEFGTIVYECSSRIRAEQGVMDYSGNCRNLAEAYELGFRIQEGGAL